MKSIVDSYLKKLVNSVVFLSLMALPWINSVRISTFLFIALGLIFIFTKDLFRVRYSQLFIQPFFLVFLAYFTLQVVAFILYPEKMNRSALEQKASLLFIPILLFVYIRQYGNSWKIAKFGFIAGNVLAAVACLIIAITSYLKSADINVFFYHQYSEVLGLSAIYFSLFLVIALIYISTYLQQFYLATAYVKLYLFAGIFVFLFINLILLSSKAVIFVGSLVVLASFLRKPFFTALQKTTVAAAFALVFAFLFFTENPISHRFREIKLNNYTAAINNHNFKDFAFDGLNLRLLLWRMGVEIGNEKQSWFTGNGGKHFHQLLNEKIAHYKLYTGVANTRDKGYLDYNLHNQYMESYVQYGLAGIVLILALLGVVFYFGFKFNNAFLVYFAVLFGLVFLTESVMERQAGILLLTIFISGEWIFTRQRQALKQAN